MSTSPNLGSESGASDVLRSRGDEIRLTIHRCVAEALEQPMDQVPRDSSLLSLGADSFHFVDLVFRLEREFGVALDRRYAIPDDQSVDTFVMAVAEALARNELLA